MSMKEERLSRVASAIPCPTLDAPSSVIVPDALMTRFWRSHWTTSYAGVPTYCLLNTRSSPTRTLLRLPDIRSMVARRRRCVFSKSIHALTREAEPIAVSATTMCAPAQRRTMGAMGRLPRGREGAPSGWKERWQSVDTGPSWDIRSVLYAVAEPMARVHSYVLQWPSRWFWSTPDHERHWALDRADRFG